MLIICLILPLDHHVFQEVIIKARFRALGSMVSPDSKRYGFLGWPQLETQTLDHLYTSKHRCLRLCREVLIDKLHSHRQGSVTTRILYSTAACSMIRGRGGDIIRYHCTVPSTKLTGDRRWTAPNDERLNIRRHCLFANVTIKGPVAVDFS